MSPQAWSCSKWAWASLDPDPEQYIHARQAFGPALPLGSGLPGCTAGKPVFNRVTGMKDSFSK